MPDYFRKPPRRPSPFDDAVRVYADDAPSVGGKRFKGWAAAGVALGLFVGGASTLGVALLTENEPAYSEADFDAPAAIAQTAEAEHKPTIVELAAPMNASASAVPARTETVAETDRIEQADPRWARDVKAVSRDLGDIAEAGKSPAEQAFAPQERAQKSAALDAVDDGDGEPMADAHDGTDDQRTAAISRESQPVKAEAKTTDAPVTGTVRIKSGVNMRAAGQKGARILGAVPRNATVQLVSCDAWCEIVYKGQRGFVYKSFVAKGEAKADGAASNAAAVADEIDKPAVQAKPAAPAEKKAQPVLDDSSRGR